MYNKTANPFLADGTNLYTNGNIRQKISDFVWANRQVGGTALALAVIFGAILTTIQFATPSLAGNDGYYHIKQAQIMRTEGLLSPFPWLPLTVLNPQDYYNHHFLYHVLLIPFTFGDLRLGAKWASVIFPTLTFLAGWLLLRKQNVPLAAVWSLGFVAVSEAFLYRMSMPRAQALSLLVLLLALHLTLNNKHWALLPLGFLYVWFYNAFPLILVVVGAYVAVQWLLTQRLYLRPLLYTVAGVGLGLIINPYFPDNLFFIYHHLAPKLADTTAIKVGNEWYPYRTWTLVENSGVGLALFAAGIMALGLQERRMTPATATLLVLSLLFGVMLFKSRRFVEYWPAFALLFSALAWTPLLQRWLKNSRWRSALLAGLLLMVFLPAIHQNIQGTQEKLQKSKSHQFYAEAATWLAHNTPSGSRVFQTDWDDFTRLFFYNTHNTYTAGLDPTYMQRYNPRLFEQWVDMTQGRIEAPAQLIVETFGARYVITDHKHKKFIAIAQADPALKLVYRDDQAIVFKVTTPQGAPIINNEP